MGCIYKITNTINDKIYIGYTTTSIETRMRKHKTDDIKSDTVLGRAIKKYGWDKFRWEILEECDDKERLLELEKYYIDKYSSHIPNGYNMTFGGERLYGENNPFYGKKHSDKTREKLSIMASNKIGDKNPFYGKHHSEDSKKLISIANSRPIEMLNDDFEVIKRFNSVSDGGKWVISEGITNNKSANSSIVKAIKHKHRAFGYYWRYVDEGVETMDDECNPVG